MFQIAYIILEMTYFMKLQKILTQNGSTLSVKELILIYHS